MRNRRCVAPTCASSAPQAPADEPPPGGRTPARGTAHDGCQDRDLPRALIRARRHQEPQARPPGGSRFLTRENVSDNIFSITVCAPGQLPARPETSRRRAMAVGCAVPQAAEGGEVASSPHDPAGNGTAGRGRAGAAAVRHGDRMGRAPVMADVARLAGVSHQTVSRVLNDHPNVRPQTREHVLAAIRELGYRRNAAARTLVTGRTNTIGVISFDTTLYGPASMLYGIEQAARPAYAVAIASLAHLDRQSIL